ncbi:hypothetical protein ABZX51_006949 [Aspergillus tubingensis]
MTRDSEANSSQEQDIVRPLKSWKGYIWDTWELPSDQRWLLFKLDAFVLTFASIGYFLKNLDLQNVTNAYLSGMEEDLEMFGNQLVTSTSIFTVGYVIGQIPANLLLTRISPRWVIPSLEIGWGIATMCMSSVKSYKALYALRFLVGLFESGFYPGIHYLLGSWYTPQEIGKRAMIFWLAGSVGSLFSGFLQAAAYTNLNGVDGRAGWRWLFIIDGIITLPLALAGYLFFPNLPQSGKKTWWITNEEHVLSVNRMRAIGRAGKEPWSMAKLKRILYSWHTYLLPMIYILWNNGYPQVGMGYWLKSFNADPPPVPGKSYTVADINNCEFIQNNMPGEPNDFKYHWSRRVGAGPLILSWINEICSADTEKRALIVAMANDLAYVVQAVAPNFVWKTTDFPAAKKGYLWSIILQVLLMVVTATVQFLLWWDRKRETRSHEAVEPIADYDADSGPASSNYGSVDAKKTPQTQITPVSSI